MARDRCPYAEDSREFRSRSEMEGEPRCATQQRDGPRLPARRREVLVLRYYAGLSEAEIAATLSISAGTVKSTAARGLAALARALKESR